MAEMEETTDAIQYEYIKEKIARILSKKKPEPNQVIELGESSGFDSSMSLDTPQILRLKKTEIKSQKILDTCIDTPNKNPQEPTTQELMRRGYSTWYSTSLFAKDKKYAPVHLKRNEERVKERIVRNGVYRNLKAVELSCMTDNVPILQFSSGEMKRMKKSL